MDASIFGESGVYAIGVGRELMPSNVGMLTASGVRTCGFRMSPVGDADPIWESEGGLNDGVLPGGMTGALLVWKMLGGRPNSC